MGFLRLSIPRFQGRILRCELWFRLVICLVVAAIGELAFWELLIIKGYQGPNPRLKPRPLHSITKSLSRWLYFVAGDRD